MIKYASAVISFATNILPLPKRATPKPVPRLYVTQLRYEVEGIQLKSGCPYEVDKLITQEQQTRLRAIALNFLVSDI
jgi:hypothetical protein